jgi:hypothetical protein
MASVHIHGELAGTACAFRILADDDCYELPALVCRKSSILRGDGGSVMTVSFDHLVGACE